MNNNERVQRFDSLPLDATYFTDEGYLVDHPIVTSVGIFVYHNPDGSERRELRLPEEVFAEKSLASYKGKPIIISYGWDVEYLMNAAIDIDDYVHLKSKYVEGYFRVYSVTIDGDNMEGSWTCTARLLEVK